MLQNEILHLEGNCAVTLHNSRHFHNRGRFLTTSELSQEGAVCCATRLRALSRIKKSARLFAYTIILRIYNSGLYRERQS